ncbi:MAG: sugar transferase, partial [Lutibacter sp.]|uniref:sugar transferase n=1 Tax=Lutibacter sp. TaxID=1925666 RepID=UPI00385BD420
FKRILDIFISLIALVLLSPVLVLVALFLGFDNKGNPFFFQTRPGLHEKLFKIIKFKTMTDALDKQGKLKSDAERLTKLGSLMRKTSLDELPQLVNVLRGDMSLIGPRPLLPEYLSLYNQEQKKRHNLRPGITGWAQVNGRNAISWQKKLEMDVYYVNNVSFLLDIKIIFLTIKKVLVKEGISSTSSVTMEKFKGNKL